MTHVVLGDVQAALGRTDNPNVLLDVTAVLSASTTIDSVVEAFAVPASSPLTIVAPAAPSAEQARWAAFTDPQNDTPGDPVEIGRAHV